MRRHTLLIGRCRGSKNRGRLFLYTGNWNWLQPWTFFRSGFYLGAVAVIVTLVSAIATFVPAHRASAIAPSDALRHQ